MLYLRNFDLYRITRRLAKTRYDYKNAYFMRKVRFQFGWADIFVNTLTGGDPRETLSSRLHKDRDTVVAGAIMRFIEILVPHHGEDVVNWTLGEGSDFDRELSGMGQCVVIFWWIVVLVAIVRAIL